QPPQHLGLFCPENAQVIGTVQQPQSRHVADRAIEVGGDDYNVYISMCSNTRSNWFRKMSVRACYSPILMRSLATRMNPPNSSRGLLLSPRRFPTGCWR